MKRNKTQHSRRRRGFTLLEIVVVVAIIAIVASLVAPRLLGNIGRSKARVAQSEVKSIAQQLNLYLVDNGMRRPTDDLELGVLIEGDDPYLRAQDLIDPWEREYILRVPGEANPDFDVISYGADGEPGGEGENADVVN